ncbi:MAG: tRNA 2-thiouridine(34) synthase MnmA [Candidatus Terrybacteria bacterium RIFCSPHIGHO2_01_FULL_48_17]|uniref:tRNA-specific 2-thiouridylase MnmA n=1 Tax=Candidatus Terrybacteria bacterium RIFCSPHIGHO2_01_FULL_48_17 TaxID=1802362 RepID=A0A1G2PJI7_9BACT|nr:MAG: tRNA 2-thiouridine(34) synthase MnmA [Candidatus Terrybacteria bacterium RIFCSPHIGHO2_01_FULL_48_17]OHA53537.1 MAG: tRNA 2-thiouridine(34) synthase MnmA [Candidatus Terrybacteria bacterium RIFCSPLOWO2_01_FULL_48_14]
MAKKRNVYLGLSGGVDSSVAAALLLEQGYNVVPVFIKCWENEVLGECPWREDQDAAYAVAEKLGVTKQFRSWNFEREFFQDVVQYLVEEAKRGRTGNPDVVCNRTIKFGVFLDRALAEGADFVATGHYARVRGTEDGVQLLRPKCEWKNDQTYFLWQLTQKQLRQVMFPVGEFTSKDLVREEARRRGLDTANRRSTRGICFVGKTPLQEFLGRFLPETPGPVVTTSGKVVGEHRGVNFYTLGQRKGIGVGDAHGPYYVKEKNTATNTLVVAPPAEMARIEKREVVVGDMNWISGTAPNFPFRARAYIRHPQPLQGCRVQGTGDRITVLFDEPQWAPTPGQSVVFYDGEAVLGGGVIQASSTS